MYDRHRVQRTSSKFPGFVEAMILMRESISIIDSSGLSEELRGSIGRASFDMIVGTSWDPTDSNPKIRKVLSFIRDVFEKKGCNLLSNPSDMDRFQSLWASLVSSGSDTFKDHCAQLNGRWFSIITGDTIPMDMDGLHRVGSFVDRVACSFDPYALIISNMIGKNLLVHQSRYNVMMSSIILYND